MLSLVLLCCLHHRQGGHVWGQLIRVGLHSCSQRLCGIDLMVFSPSWLPESLEPKAKARPWDWSHRWWQRECFW